MKGIILHGGHGTRLRPLTHTGPKQLLPIANKPMSQYCLESLKDAGIHDIAIIIGGTAPHKVQEYYKNGEDFGVKITYIEQDEPRGISHAVKLCQNFIGDEKFVVFLGDNILTKPINIFTKEFSKSDADAMLLLCEVDNPTQFGIADVNSDYKNIEIILVDNASTDSSQLACKEKFSQIRLICNTTNLGYCEGNNVGIKESKGEFVVILNPDTCVDPKWLSVLLSAYEKFGEGLYQPKLLAADDSFRINTAGNMINVLGFGYSRGKGKKDNELYNKMQVINYSSGACLFTSKKVLEKVGFFDSFLFAYHDDLDLGWRAAQLGIKSYYIPTSIVYHAESATFKWSPKKFYLLERNRLYCILTHYSRKNFYKILPALILVELMIIVFYFTKGLGREKIAGYRELIINRHYIQKRYQELEAKKVVSDREIIKNFQDGIEVPLQVAGAQISSVFNGCLLFLSKIARRVIT